MADENQLTEPWPGYATKAEVEAWYSTASPGEKSAVNQVARDFRAWQTNPQNAWFGQSIREDTIEAKVRELAKKYNAPLRYCTYNTNPLLSK